MRLLALLAGPDDAFLSKDARFPKNFVQVADGSVLETVISGYRPFLDDPDTKFVFCVRAEESERFRTADVIRLLVPGATVVEVPQSTGGALCTALLAIGHLPAEDELLVCNGDMLVDVDLSEVVQEFRDRGLDGGLVTFDAVHPRWSYVRLDDGGFVVEAAEKRPISTIATAGVYWFRRAADFVEAAFATITKDAHVAGAFYVCPAYNELVLRQKRISTFHVERGAYHSLSDPRGVAEYEELIHRENR